MYLIRFDLTPPFVFIFDRDTVVFYLSPSWTRCTRVARILELTLCNLQCALRCFSQADRSSHGSIAPSNKIHVHE